MAITREQFIAFCDAAAGTTPNASFFNTFLDFLISAGYPDVASAMTRLMNSMSLHTTASQSSAVVAGIADVNFQCQNVEDRTTRP